MKREKERERKRINRKGKDAEDNLGLNKLVQLLIDCKIKHLSDPIRLKRLNESETKGRFLLSWKLTNT